MNRDYFTKPIQTSRSSHDYGHSGKIEPMTYDDNPSGALIWIVGANLVGGLVLALMFFAWIG